MLLGVLIITSIPTSATLLNDGTSIPDSEPRINKVESIEDTISPINPYGPLNNPASHSPSDQIRWDIEDNDEALPNTFFSSDSLMIIYLKTAAFDPLKMEPYVPQGLLTQSENGYYLVQCQGPTQPDWIEKIKNTGAEILGYIPNFTYLVYMDGDMKEIVKALSFIRWIGIYHPAYKIQTGILEMTGDAELNVLVFDNKEGNLQKVREELKILGGVITDSGEDNHIIRVKIDSSQIRSIAFIPEVEWIDIYSPPKELMNNVRVFTGAETLHINGLNGTGIVGEVKDNGFDEDHPDFQGQIIGTDGNPVDDAHGTCTFGIVFSSGANDDDAKGMLPGGKGVFADWGVGRTTSIDNLVDKWGGLFQSNSWYSGYLDSTYSTYSAEDDQIVFDYDVLMLYGAGNSNFGVYSESCSQDSIAKNVIAVGAVYHYDDDDKSNDQWVNYGQYYTPSQGPASDGRVKPDLAGVFDWIYTTDSVDGDGENGYVTGNYYDDMGGTSGATPIAAGSAGLVYQMYRENHFGNNPSGTLPHAATVKAILIADAHQYDFSQADRYQQGWGLVDVGNVYNIGRDHFIVDEVVSLETGESVSYKVIPTEDVPLKISLVWTDVPGTTSSSTSKLSSEGGNPDTLNNVENVFIENPISGIWTIEIDAQNIAMDGNSETADVDQSFALVASGAEIEHDISVSEIQSPNYLKPNQQTQVNATVMNIGNNDEDGITITLKVDKNPEKSTTITSLDSGESTTVSFTWSAPSFEGNYLIEIESSTLPNEYNINNNKAEKTVTVTNGPQLGRIGLVSDGSQLQSITPFLDDLGKSYDILNNNMNTGFTKNLTILLQYQMVIFYNDNRAISGLERQILDDYLSLGGVLLVTGLDSLGGPSDSNLAKVVRSSEYGDNPGESSFSVTDGAHPIMDGVYGQYSTSSTFSLGESNHDMAEADFTLGAQTVAELPDGQDKIIAAELSTGGRVVYWNGNRDCNDWTNDEDLEAMLKNLIVWIMPIYNDVGVVSIDSPAEAFVGDTLSIGATILNYGLNYQSNVEVTLNIKNSYGFTVYSNTKSGISISSWESTYKAWQWNPNLSDYYIIEISTTLAGDEVSANDIMTKPITIYFRFFTDDMESGQGEWAVSSSSITRPPLWHLTTSESHSPTTSWWCGEDVTEQYTVMADEYLTSPVIDLRNAEVAYLKFFHQYAIDDFPLMPDWGYVEINSDGGGWVELDSYSGTWMSWTEVNIDISDYVGNQIQIRFTLASGVILTDNGWWADDMEIFGMGTIYDMDLSTSNDAADVGWDEQAIFQIQVSNTGNTQATVELSWSGTNMEDWDVSFSHNGFDLLPGLTDFVILTITPQTADHGDYTLFVEGALWADAESKAQDTLPLFITILQWYEIELTTQNETQNFIPAETKYYEIEIINQGNGYDEFSLTLDYSISGTSTSWQFELDKTSAQLEPYYQENLTVEVTAPSNALAGDSITIHIIATSLGDPSKSETLSTISLVIEYYSIELNSSQSLKETEPASSVSYSITIINLGNTQVNVDIDISPSTGAWGAWNLLFSADSFYLDAFASKTVSFSITPPADILAYEFRDFDVTATSTNSVSEMSIRTVIALSGELEIQVDSKEKTGSKGGTSRYYISLKNEQNHEDIFDVSAISISGWEISFFAANGITQLFDTDSDGIPDTGLLNPYDGTAEIVVDVAIPEHAMAYTEDLVTVTFSSSQPTGGDKSTVLETTCALSGGIILDTESYSKNEAPKEQIIYLVSVTNSFNYQAVIDLTVSSDNDWELDLFEGSGSSYLVDTNDNGIPDTGSLDALGETTDIMIILTLPDDAEAYTTDVITLTGSSSLFDEDTYPIQLNATVKRIFGVDIKLEEDELSVKQGKELLYNIRIINKGNYDEELDLRFRELPDGWRADFSNDEPSIDIDGYRIITVTMDVPSDTEIGEYEVTIYATSKDDGEIGELTLVIDVQEQKGEAEIPYMWLLLVILIICIIIATFMMMKRMSSRREMPQGAIPVTAQSQMYGGMIFPTIEMISCPDCSNLFEVEIGQKPFSVQCPRCGASGVIR
jgi:uncharacterized membrane protein